MTRKIAELAYDLHAGLSAHQVPDFDDLNKIGMAATVAVHLKGLGEIPYDVLRQVSEHFMSVPSIALEPVLRILEEVNFVRLVEKGRKIEKVIPNIPVFDDIYDGIGAFAVSELALNSHEEAIIAILSSLQDAPRNRDQLFHNLGMDKSLFDRSLVIGNESGIISEQMARGRPMLISPYYFADNLDVLVDAAADVGAEAIRSVLKKVETNQGWPLSLIGATSEIGGTKLSSTEIELIQKFSQEGVIKPPTIKFGEHTQSFVFTPRPGNTRLNAGNREIYERAMALISAVRKGQLLPDRFKIKYPLKILEAFRDRGYLKSTSEAFTQYHNLVVLRVATLKPVGGGGRWQLHLLSTPENKAALDLAINLLRTGQLASMEVDQEARIALTKDETYIQSLVSASELKRRQKQIKDEQASHEFEQLLLKFE